MDVMESSRLTASESHDMLVGPNSYGRVLPNNSVLMPNSAGMISGMHLSFNTMPSFVLKPSDSSTSVYQGDGSPGMRPGSGLGFMGEPLKKKRGRPRKYERDGTMALSWTPLPSASGYCSTPSLEPPSKRQGCPPVSGKKQQLDALGSSRIAFTVHIITVNPGEDVASKIMAFSQQGPHTVCILSANGVISNVTLRQPATSGGTVIYEGRFEIISLSGSFLLTENGVIHTRTGGLSVALSGSDGHVVGGAVSGMLMAATPVQVAVGSFIAEAKTDPLKHEPSPAAPKMAACFRGASATPPSEGTSSESFEEDDPGSSSPNQSAGTCYNNFSPQVPKLSEYISFSWSHSAVK